MFRLQKGGVVREVATQKEADSYVDIGYEIISSGAETAEADDDADPKLTDPGKKSGSKE